MYFKNRKDAGERLAKALKAYAGKHPLVLGIPRGGVVLADAIARVLGGEVDVVLVHKLGAPGEPEFAIGSVDEQGRVHLSEYAEKLRLPRGYVEEEKERQLEAMRTRRAAYTPVRTPLDPSRRIVIIVDDGLATGETMGSALAAVRARRPATLVCAVPVASDSAREKVKALADEVVCLDVPAFFGAVGQFYEDFGQVSDEEVIDMLRKAAGS
jgi:putative phosphoribosyl transferase